MYSGLERCFAMVDPIIGPFDEERSLRISRQCLVVIDTFHVGVLFNSSVHENIIYSISPHIGGFERQNRSRSLFLSISLTMNFCRRLGSGRDMDYRRGAGDVCSADSISYTDAWFSPQVICPCLWVFEVNYQGHRGDGNNIADAYHLIHRMQIGHVSRETMSAKTRIFSDPVNLQ